MGHNKLFLELEGKTLLQRTVDHALAAELQPLVVVLGHEADRVGASLSGVACEKVRNPEYTEGIHTSARVGVNALGDRANAVIMLLADMPFVTSEMIATLVARYREERPPLVVSLYGEVTAPPVLYDRSLFEELRCMEKGCGREVVRRHRDEATMVEWQATALNDIDVTDDYARVRETLAEC